MAAERAAVYSALLVVGFFAVVSYGKLQHNARDAAKNDAVRYIEMSEDTFAAVDNPFALRLLTPWLVRKVSALTGIAPDTVWLALTFVATMGALITIYELMRRSFRLSVGTSTVAVLLLAVTYNYTSYNYGNFWLVDPLNNLVFALALFCVFERKLVLFVGVLLVGMVNKETAVLLAPLFPLLQWARVGRLRDKTVVLAAGASVAVVVAYLVFRAWAQSRIGDNGTWIDQSVTNIARIVLSSRPRGEHLAVFGIFNFLWVVFAYGLYRQYRASGLRSELLIASSYLFMCCLIGRMQATDTERVWVMLAPLVVVVAATVFDDWRSEAQRLWLVVLAAVYAALNFAWFAGESAVLVNLAALVVFVLVVHPPLRLTGLTVHGELGREERGGGSAGPQTSEPSTARLAPAVPAGDWARFTSPAHPGAVDRGTLEQSRG